jgi:hypothetical protein
LNIVSPNFIDFNLDFRERSFLNIARLKPTGGGVNPLINTFGEINWIKPSTFNRLCNDDVVAYFVDVGDGVKKTAVNYSLCELCVDIDFAHVMYGDYFVLRPAAGATLSVDFAGIANADHAEKILSCSNVKYAFCSDHDTWADAAFLSRQSVDKAIIWHSPECVRLYFNQSMFLVHNDKFVPTKKIVVGAGDLLAVRIMFEVYKKEFDEVTPESLIEAISIAMSFVGKRYFS